MLMVINFSTNIYLQLLIQLYTKIKVHLSERARIRRCREKISDKETHL